MTPTLSDLLAAALEEFREGFFVALPARVESYDPATQTVSAQPLVLRGYQREDGTRGTERLPVVPHCPVQWPAGGGMVFALPLRAGDDGILLFASASLDRWFARGVEVDPADDRRGRPDDAFFLPGGRSAARALTAPSDENAILGNDEGAAKITITPDEIQAGGTSALALQATIQALKDVFTSWVVAPMDGGGALKTLLNGWSAGTGTAVLKGG